MNKKPNLFKYTYYYCSQYKGLFFLIIFGTIIGSGLGIAAPKIIQLILDENVGYLVKKDLKMIYTFMGLFFALIILKVIGTYILGYFGRVFQIRISHDLKRKTFSHYEKINVPYIDSVNEGMIINRINNDSTNIGNAIRFMPENIFSILIVSISSFTIVFTYQILLGIILIIVFFSLMVFAYFLRKTFRKAWLRVKKVEDETLQLMVNSVSGVKETKAYTSEKREIMLFRKQLKKLFKSWKYNFKIYASWMSVNVLILSMITFVILCFGIPQVINNNLTILSLVAITMYGGQIIEPINKTLAIVDMINQGSASVIRVEEFLNQPIENYNFKPKEKLPKILNGEIVFKNVSLAYPNSDTYILKNINFTIKPGQKIAFVGETGSGKSTILKALIKFYPIKEGEIFLDGININEFPIQYLRQHITYLQQDSYMFFDTIQNNVEYGLADKNQGNAAESLELMLDLTLSKKFVSKLPDGHNSIVGPKGVNLSGGQKQRLSIARAMMKNSQILLFDEATSALDTTTEKLIKENMDKIIEKKTVIFIAHRLSTIRNVDRIFVINDGQIVESGSHSELVKRDGYYYNLIKSDRS